jgi:hypothetical protein
MHNDVIMNRRGGRRPLLAGWHPTFRCDSGLQVRQALVSNLATHIEILKYLLPVDPEPHVRQATAANFDLPLYLLVMCQLTTRADG